MAGQIYLLFSSDYELYFGENYLSEREVLIEPTEQVLKAFGEEGIPMNIFADVASVWRYRTLKIESDYVSLVEEQLRRAIRYGHDVQLHLHPHWMTSKFDGKKWLMDESRFKLSDIGYGQKENQALESGDELILRGKNYLEELLCPINPSYQCIAFRAGGFGIQPKENELIRALLSAGIKIDSSIAPGMFFKSNVNRIDFRRIPSKLNFRIGPRYGLDKEDPLGLFEIPIAAYSESFFETLLHHWSVLRTRMTLLGNRIFAVKGKFCHRGKTIQKLSFFRQVNSLIFRPSLFLLEFSGPSVDVPRLIRGTNKLIRSHNYESGALFFSASCHPKNVFSPTIQAIREFWRIMVGLYGKRIKAITFQEAAKKLEYKALG